MGVGDDDGPLEPQGLPGAERGQPQGRAQGEIHVRQQRERNVLGVGERLLLVGALRAHPAQGHAGPREGGGRGTEQAVLQGAAGRSRDPRPVLRQAAGSAGGRVGEDHGGGRVGGHDVPLAPAGRGQAEGMRYGGPGQRAQPGGLGAGGGGAGGEGAVAEDEAVGPVLEPDQHGGQRPAGVGQVVLVSDRPPLVRAALQHGVIEQVLEPLGQHAPRDGQLGLEVVEAMPAPADLPHDEQAPPLADHRRGLRDGAAGVQLAHLSCHPLASSPSTASVPSGFQMGIHLLR